MSIGSKVVLFVVVGAASFLAGFIRDRWPYYSLGAPERTAHERHVSLRSSGRVGLAAGIAGTALIGLNLAYLVRKRLPHWRLGSLRTWMASHVLTGFGAFFLIVLHSSLLLRSALGTLAIGALAVVIVTGVVGRYIYALTPRSLEGKELEIEEVRRQILSHQEELEALGVDHALLAEDPDGAFAVLSLKPRSFGAVLASLLWGDRDLKRQIRRIRSGGDRPGTQVKSRRRVVKLLRAFHRETLWLDRYQELRGLMGSWRFLHRWLAILMALLALFHIGVALRFGEIVRWGGAP